MAGTGVLRLGSAARRLISPDRWTDGYLCRAKAELRSAEVTALFHARFARVFCKESKWWLCDFASVYACSRVLNLAIGTHEVV